MNNEKVTKLFVEPKKVVSIELDARHQIADANKSNNAFPQRAAPSRLEVFRQTHPTARNQMADALVELKAKEQPASPAAPITPSAKAAMTARGRRLTRRLAIAGGLALAAAPPAFAHRSQSVLTTVNWNAATSTLEVMHRIHAHDAEVGLMQSTGSTENVDITQVRNQAQLMLYVEKHFSLTGPAGPSRWRLWARNSSRRRLCSTRRRS